MGDRRSDGRLSETFDGMGKRPAGALPQKLAGRAELVGGTGGRNWWAELVGGFRVFNNPG